MRNSHRCRWDSLCQHTAVTFSAPQLLNKYMHACWLNASNAWLHIKLLATRDCLCHWSTIGFCCYVHFPVQIQMLAQDGEILHKHFPVDPWRHMLRSPSFRQLHTHFRVTVSSGAWTPLQPGTLLVANAWWPVNRLVANAWWPVNRLVVEAWSPSMNQLVVETWSPSMNQLVVEAWSPSMNQLVVETWSPSMNQLVVETWSPSVNQLVGEAWSPPMNRLVAEAWSPSVNLLVADASGDMLWPCFLQVLLVAVTLLLADLSGGHGDAFGRCFLMTHSWPCLQQIPLLVTDPSGHFPCTSFKQRHD